MSEMRTKAPPAAPEAAGADAPAENYLGADRRRSTREPHFVPATLQPPSGNADVDEAVLVCNLSLGGVGLLCDHRYRAGTVWRVTLGNGPLFLNAKVRVVSCRARPDGRYDVGCAFC